MSLGVLYKHFTRHCFKRFCQVFGNSWCLKSFACARCWSCAMWYELKARQRFMLLGVPYKHFTIPWLNKGQLWSVWGNSWCHEAFSYNNIWWPYEYHGRYNFEQCLVWCYYEFPSSTSHEAPFKLHISRLGACEVFGGTLGGTTSIHASKLVILNTHVSIQDPNSLNHGSGFQVPYMHVFCEL
jgi:hypothetical protein